MHKWSALAGLSTPDMCTVNFALPGQDLSPLSLLRWRTPNPNKVGPQDSEEEEDAPRSKQRSVKKPAAREKKPARGRAHESSDEEDEWKIRTEDLIVDENDRRKCVACVDSRAGSCTKAVLLRCPKAAF